MHLLNSKGFCENLLSAAYFVLNEFIRRVALENIKII